jgi:hypothetical protein
VPYVVTVPRVVIAGADLRERLKSALCALPAFEAARLEEIEAAKGRLVTSAKGVPPDLRERVRTAEDKARTAALAYERAARIAKHTEGVLARAKEGHTEGAAYAFARAQAEADEALDRAKQAEEIAESLTAELRAAIPPEEIDHIATLFDAQITSGIEVVARYVAGGALGAAKAVKFQLAGHVELRAYGTAFCSVHVWPGDP